MAERCEDYPCCGHTDDLGCNYTPDRDYYYIHSYCDHELGYCQLVDDPSDSDDWCRQCGEPMKYSYGIEGSDYIWAYVPIPKWGTSAWDYGLATQYRYDCRHIDCFPEGTSLDSRTAELLGVS